MALSYEMRQLSHTWLLHASYTSISIYILIGLMHFGARHHLCKKYTITDCHCNHKWCQDDTIAMEARPIQIVRTRSTVLPSLTDETITWRLLLECFSANVNYLHTHSLLCPSAGQFQTRRNNTL